MITQATRLQEPQDLTFQHGGMGGCLAHLSGGLDAVQAGHLQVHDDHVGLEFDA